MAITIKTIPTLIDKDARAFVNKADASINKRSTVEFSQQVRTADAILKKAKMI